MYAGLAASALVAGPARAQAAETTAADREAAADVLAIGMTQDDRERLWPLEVRLAIVSDRDGPPALPPTAMVVRDGHAMRFDNTVWTPRGLARFHLEVTPRHHPGRAVELQWELVVEYAPYALGPDAQSWKRYLLYRLGLGPRPELRRPRVAAVRADIVETRGETVEAAVPLPGATYRLRLFARSTHG